MKKTKLSSEEQHRLHLLQEEKNQELIKRFILDEAESKVTDIFSDSELDHELDKRKLLDTLDQYWRIKNLDQDVQQSPSDYEKIYPQEFYKEIFRLNGWKYEGSISQKPWIVGKYTNEIIYYRFSAEVLPFLRIVNPYFIPGKRKNKHHQYLTPGARVELQRFIEESINVMKQCSDWNEFRIKYCNKYNVPYQLKIIF